MMMLSIFSAESTVMSYAEISNMRLRKAERTLEVFENKCNVSSFLIHLLSLENVARKVYSALVRMSKKGIIGRILYPHGIRHGRN